MRNDSRERHRFPGLSAIARTILKLLALIFFASPRDFRRQPDMPLAAKIGSRGSLHRPKPLQMILDDWLPKSVQCFRNYNGRKFVADVVAGITVGLVALPLAMAFAIASGVPPQAGLYTAIIAGFLISALGGSTTQIGGPTGAFVVVVYGIVARHGMDGLYMCTLMAGVLLVILGVTGLGTAVKFIPRPVVVGFHKRNRRNYRQHADQGFLRPEDRQSSRRFSVAHGSLVANFRTLSLLETGLGVLSLALILVFARYVKKVPGYIVALFVGTALVVIFKLPVETIGTRFGGIPSGLPKFSIPHFRLDLAATVDFAGHYGRDARCDRIADVRGGFRPHERRQAQPERGTGGAGRRQHFFAALRRLAGHRRHRSHRDEYPLRREDAGCRNDSRAHAAGDRDVRRAAGRDSFRFRRWRRFFSSFLTTWASGAKFQSC